MKAFIMRRVSPGNKTCPKALYNGAYYSGISNTKNKNNNNKKIAMNVKKYHCVKVSNLINKYTLHQHNDNKKKVKTN